LWIFQNWVEEYIGDSIDLHSHPTDIKIKFGQDTFHLNPDDTCSCVHMGTVKDEKEAHNKRVLEYFQDKPGKLLVLDFKDIGTEKFEKDIFTFLILETLKM
tara:strand:- start:48 stop:350 length:303 start_codon:yes stop_codon:yes gene_type:complete